MLGFAPPRKAEMYAALLFTNGNVNWSARFDEVVATRLGRVILSTFLIFIRSCRAVRT